MQNRTLVQFPTAGTAFTTPPIRLLVGNDIVSIYRMADSKETTIEIFKCGDAARPKT
jgi:hypothetical protein